MAQVFGATFERSSEHAPGAAAEWALAHVGEYMSVFAGNAWTMGRLVLVHDDFLHVAPDSGSGIKIVASADVIEIRCLP